MEFIRLKKLCIAATSTFMTLLVGQVANAKSNSFSPNLQPFECSNTESMNVAKFVPQIQSTQPLMLQTVVHGDSCGFEGGKVTGVEGVTITRLNLQISGTTDQDGFGPFIEIFYNGGSNVRMIALRSARRLGKDGPQYTQLEFLAKDLALPAGAQISGMQIITNPNNAEDGKCFIRQLRINGTLVTKTQTVINACP